MRKMLTLSLVVALGILVGAGCGKNAKINLAGLAENAPGSMTEDGKGMTPSGNEIGGEDGLVPLAPGGAVPGGDGALAGGAGVDPLANVDPNSPAGGWSDTSQGLSGGSLNGAPFVKNGNYWSEIVYFDFNRYEVRPSERVKLDGLAEHLRANPKFRVVIEGHCDERGSDEYNRSLSERRSLSVQTYLVTLGIDESRIQTVSYGEDKPAVQNAQSDSDHQLNRRAEFLVGLP